MAIGKRTKREVDDHRHECARRRNNPRADDDRGTWNSPDAIERHRDMTPEDRFRAAADLSRAALRFRDAERVDAG
ncbi:MAG: hypothetical protein M3350_03890 [Actinomycetota bacterium]|nr:hypothetical protein [Actinomycetota bacterium]